MRKLMVIAAEASSAHYALGVMRELKSFDQKLQFFGVGTEAMENEGFRRIGRAEEMAIMGLVEVIKHYPRLKEIFEALVQAAISERPDAILLLDYPDFNLRLAERLKPLGFRIFYYISPQVWAWRQNRIHQIKRVCELVFLIFPFEIDFYQKHQVPHEFVGHPLLDDLKPEYFSRAARELRLQKFGIAANEKVLLLMPGSRRGEIDRLFDFELSVADKLVRRHPHIRVVVACAPTVSREDLLNRMERVQFPYLVLKEDPAAMIALADAALVASGTATLLVGLLEKPMVIIYKVARLTGYIGSWLARHLQFFGLPNLVLNRHVTLELKQEQVTLETVVPELERLLFDETARTKMIADLAQIKHRLGGAGANQRVAQYLWQNVFPQKLRDLGH